MSPTLWTEGWFVSIINHLWQSTLVVLLAFLLAWVLKRNQARARYWVWIAASVKFLVPFTLFVAIGQWLRPAATPRVQSSHIASAIVNMAQPFSASLQNEPVNVPLPEPSIAAPALHQAHLLPAFLVTVWLLGFLFLLVRWARHWWAIRAAVRSASPMPLSTDVPVLSSSLLLEPGVFGIFRPVLLLPEKIVSQLSAPQLRSILAHEMCHVRRRDNLTAAIHMMIAAIFWFHPAVWWIGSRLLEERERACDEAVLQLGNEAEVYAESIITVCRFYRESPVACMSGVTGSDLKRRIVRIMTEQVGRKLDPSRKLLLSVTAVMAVALPVTFGLVRAPEVRAQSAPATPGIGIAATWQGTLHGDRDSRIVVEITKASDATLRATFYYIDWRPEGIPAISATSSGSLLKFELPFGTYAGKVSADGDSITGTWTQGQNPVPLNFARATPATEWPIPQPKRLPAMAADANPTFEVATVKPSRPEEQGPRFNPEGRHFSFIHASLSDLANFAYGVQERQILGAPDWFSSERYDISAESDGEGEPSMKQWKSMVGKLMTDRFQLKLHTEKREIAVYALTAIKTGPNLARSQGDPSTGPGIGFGPGNFGATNATMADVADAMGFGILDRPVVDQTGLLGRFDLRLRWTPDAPLLGTGSADGAPDLFTAIQKQLGLKLVSTKAPVDVLVIEHVEKPSPN